MNITLDDLPERPKKTAIQKLQEQLEQQMAPFRQLQDMQNAMRLHGPEYHMEKLLKQLEPSVKIRDLLGRTSISQQVQEMLDARAVTLQTQKLMEQYFPKNPLGMSEEMWRQVSGIGAISEAVKKQERYLKPFSQQQEMLETLQRQAFGGFLFENLAGQLQRANPTLAAMETARQSLDSLWGQFRDIDFSQFQVDDDDEQDAERAVHTIVKDAGEQQSFHEAIERIVASIQAQTKPTVQLRLWLFFVKVMELLASGAIAAAMAHYAPAVLGASPQEAKKTVQQTARVTVGSAELLAEYRYVATKFVIVRQNPKARSPEIGRLTFGNAVKLVKKDKDFALVLWTDRESGAEIQGWVFARYLEKFN